MGIALLTWLLGPILPFIKKKIFSTQGALFAFLLKCYFILLSIPKYCSDKDELRLVLTIIMNVMRKMVYEIILRQKYRFNPFVYWKSFRTGKQFTAQPIKQEKCEQWKLDIVDLVNIWCWTNGDKNYMIWDNALAMVLLFKR